MSQLIKARKNSRQQISEAAVEKAVADFRMELARRLGQYGHGTYASRHEALGVVEEEVHELKQAVHASALSGRARHLTVKSKYMNAFKENGNTVRAELMDVAVAAIFSVACIDEDGLAW